MMLNRQSDGSLRSSHRWTGALMALPLLAVVAACTGPSGSEPNPSAPEPAVQGHLSAPESVVGGEQFTLSASDDIEIRQMWATARGDAEAWVLRAEQDGEPPTARPGDDSEDVLQEPTGSLELAFDASTTPGDYELCVAVTPVYDQESSDQRCVTITVT